MKEGRQPRSKRSSFVINLVETASGYSLIEGTQLLNKVSVQSVPQHSTIVTAVQQGIPTPSLYPVPKQQRAGKRINLIAIKNSRLGTPKNEQAKAPESNIETKGFAEWFDMGSIHEKQQNMLITWVKEGNIKVAEGNIRETQQFKNLISEYKSHRNQIVKLYLEEYAPKKKYLTASQIRKYICADAYWLMRLHIFLSSWGIINSHQLSFDHQYNEQQYLFKEDPATKLLKMMPFDLSLQPNIHEHTNSQSQNELLKKLTTKMRPYCDSCGIHCGIVWFQHLRVMDSKQIASIMKNVNSKNPVLSDKQYEIVLCTRCYCDGHFPLLLTHHDFKKISVNDRLEPNKKKKHKKKNKNKKKKKDRERYEQEEEQREPESEHQKSPSKQQPVKLQMNINSMIETILSSQEADKKWRSQEVLRMLQLVEQYGESWQKIHSVLQEEGHCSDKTPEEIIGYFLSLPKRGVSKISEQHSYEEFMKDNHHSNNTNMIDLIHQKSLLKISKPTSREQKVNRLKQRIQAKQKETHEWKNSLDDFIRLFMGKTLSDITGLEKLSKVSSEHLRTTQEFYKRVSLKDI